MSDYWVHVTNTVSEIDIPSGYDTDATAGTSTAYGEFANRFITIDDSQVPSSTFSNPATGKTQTLTGTSLGYYFRDLTETNTYAPSNTTHAVGNYIGFYTNPHVDQVVLSDSSPGPATSDVYDFGTYTQTLKDPLVTTGYGNFVQSIGTVPYTSGYWFDAGKAPDNYSLHLSFKQGADAGGNLKPGTLTAVLMDDTTGTVAYKDTKVASCDDAFPLKNVANETSISSPQTKVSGHLGLVFDINNFARGSNQSDVELHVGSPQLSPTSADSQSCLVVSQKNFLSPLEAAIAKVAGIGGGSASDLSGWINQNLPVTLSTNVTMSQPTLSTVDDGSGAFHFDLSRPNQKEAAVIYSVVGSSGKVLTTREAFIEPGTTGTDSISLSSLRQGADQPVDSSTFSNLPGISNSQYNNTFGSAARLPSGSQVKVKIDGYAVHLQSNSGKDLWYWDSKQDGSSSMAGEHLMLSGTNSKNPLSLTVPTYGGSPLSDKIASQSTAPDLDIVGGNHSLLGTVADSVGDVGGVVGSSKIAASSNLNLSNQSAVALLHGFTQASNTSDAQPITSDLSNVMVDHQAAYQLAASVAGLHHQHA